MKTQNNINLWLALVITQLVILLTTVFQHEWVLLTIAMIIAQVALFYGLIKQNSVNPSKTKMSESKAEHALPTEQKEQKPHLDSEESVSSQSHATQSKANERQESTHEPTQEPSAHIETQPNRERLAFGALEHLSQAVVAYENGQLVYANKTALAFFHVDSISQVQLETHFPSKQLNTIQNALSQQHDIPSLLFNMVDAQSNIIDIELKCKHDQDHCFLYLQRAQRNQNKPEIAQKSTEEEIKTVLLVDDSMTNRLLMNGLLTSQGWKVSCAENGTQAIEIAARDVFDVILMDLQMQNIDGLLASQHIRNIKHQESQIQHKSLNQDTPIIAMSSALDEALQLRIDQSGINDFLNKPITKNNLNTILSNYFDENNFQQKHTHSKTQDSTHNTLEGLTPPTEEVLFEPSMIHQMQIDIGEERSKKMGLIALQEIEKRLVEIESVLEEKDILNIKRQAHTIKSTAASFGLMALSHIAKNIELCCDEHQHETFDSETLHSKTLNTLTIDLRNVFNSSKPYIETSARSHE